MKEKRGGESLRMRRRRKRKSESALRVMRAKFTLLKQLLPFRCGNVECKITVCTYKF